MSNVEISVDVAVVSTDDVAGGSDVGGVVLEVEVEVANVVLLVDREDVLVRGDVLSVVLLVLLVLTGAEVLVVNSTGDLNVVTMCGYGVVVEVFVVFILWLGVLVAMVATGEVMLVAGLGVALVTSLGLGVEPSCQVPLLCVS